MIVRRYHEEDAVGWNGVNAAARNGHFLFDRGFMEYHRDRFDDHSLIATEDDRIQALLPANRAGDIVFSHQGLTFGGLVLADACRQSRVLSVVDSVMTHLREAGIRRFVYKPLPSIYAVRPASEDLYALYRQGASLVRRDASTAIDYGEQGALSNRRTRGAKKAAKSGLSFIESDRWAEFWEVLSETLRSRHAVAPVHELTEIRLLANRFPASIRLFVASEGGSIVAGVVLFETVRVAHAQYIAASERGRDIGALDGLFLHVIDHFRQTKRYFDFGISTEDGGRRLNEGLIAQKEEFGGSTIVHDVYELVL